jgi:hypothetical protein
MCRRVALLRTDILEERIASILHSLHPDDGGDKILRNAGSNKSHTVTHPRRRHF